MGEEKELKETEEVLEEAIKMIHKLNLRDQKIEGEFLDPVLRNAKALKKGIDALLASHVKVKTAVDKIIPELEHTTESVRDLKGCLKECKLFKQQAIEPELKKIEPQYNEYVEAGEYSAGIRFLREKLAQFRHSGTYWYYLGILYHFKGDSRRALQAYEKSIALEPDRFEPRCAAILLHLDSKDYERALPEVVSAYQQFPLQQCHDYYSRVGNLFEEIGTREGIEALSLDLIPGKKPECIDCFVSYLYYRIGELDTAYDMIQGMDDPECGLFNLLRAVVSILQEGIEECNYRLQDISLDIPLSGFSMHLLRDLLESLIGGNYMLQVRDWLKKALEHMPTDVEIADYSMYLEELWFWLNMVKLEDRNWLLSVGREIQKNHDCPRIRDTLVDLLVKTDALEDAVREVSKAMSDYPQSKVLRIRAAWAFNQMGMDDKMVETVSQVLDAESEGLPCMHVEMLLNIAKGLDNQLGLDILLFTAPICRERCPERIEAIDQEIASRQQALQNA